MTNYLLTVLMIFFAASGFIAWGMLLSFFWVYCLNNMRNKND